MYLSYARLWGKLHENNLSASELCSVSGVSFTTLEKLRKHRRVMTNDLLKICEYFDCEVNDVTEIINNKLSDKYYSLMRNRKYAGNRKNDCFSTCEFEYMGTEYAVHKIRKLANSNSVIFCSNGGLLWRQIYFKMAIPGIVMYDDFELFDVADIEDNKVNIVIIPGVPGNINSLDEYAFTSWRGKTKTTFRLYLMTEKAFRNFEPIHELV